MRVVGIDCGSERTGYGVIDSDGRRHQLIGFGVIRASPKADFPSRLYHIYKKLKNLLNDNAPDDMAVEGVFHATNVRTVLKLAQVRGVALMAAAEHGLPVGEYSPLEVKSSVVGYGRATKEQVQTMVGSLLRLQEPIESDDAADALAVAICHSVYAATRAKIAAGAGANG